MLFEAVENLANALKEVQNLRNMDLEAKKCELNSYRKYCDHAAGLMRETEEAAPYATDSTEKRVAHSGQKPKRASRRDSKESKNCMSRISRYSNTRNCMCCQ